MEQLSELEETIFEVLQNSDIGKWDQVKGLLIKESRVSSKMSFFIKNGGGDWDNAQGIRPTGLMRVVHGFVKKNPEFEGKNWQKIEFIFNQDGIESRTFSVD